jgi:membrane associated rhomboid family serine protease
MYGNTSIWDDLKMQYRYGSGTTRLILAILGVFVVTKVLLLVDFFAQTSIFNAAWGYLMLPSSLETLLYRPWTIFTYMFYHAGFFHLLFNLLGIYWFGRVVSEFFGQSKVVPIFLLGGVMGGLLYILAYNLLPVFAPVAGSSFNMGASGGVLALLLAGAVLVPNYTFNLLIIGSVKLKWIAVFYVLLDLISIPDSNAGGHLTHLGGALFGYLYVVLLHRGTDLARIIFFVSDLPQTIRDRWSGKKMKVHSRQRRTKVEAGVAGQQKSRQHQPSGGSSSKQERLDAILDKINQSGYDSLTKAEKEFLFEMSKDN